MLSECLCRFGSFALSREPALARVMQRLAVSPRHVLCAIRSLQHAFRIHFRAGTAIARYLSRHDVRSKDNM